MVQDDGLAMRNEMTTTEERRRYAQEAAIFEQLYPRVEGLLKRFGRPNYVPGQPLGDYAVHGDYSGHPQVVVFISNLEMLRPAVVHDLRQLIKEYSGWQITMTVAIRGHHHDWPNMGLYIRPQELIDGLQRQYFPKEFQGIEYEGARRGTAYD
jgi:hypothetical protein